MSDRSPFPCVSSTRTKPSAVTSRTSPSPVSYSAEPSSLAVSTRSGTVGQRTCCIPAGGTRRGYVMPELRRRLEWRSVGENRPLRLTLVPASDVVVQVIYQAILVTIVSPVCYGRAHGYPWHGRRCGIRCIGTWPSRADRYPPARIMAKRDRLAWHASYVPRCLSHERWTGANAAPSRQPHVTKPGPAVRGPLLRWQALVRSR
jgi:hypothetical protein